MSVKHKITGTLPAFRHRNYRLFWVGQGISLIGTQMQIVAMTYLIYEVTKSASMTQYVTAAGMLPALVLGMFAGMIAGRVNKRKMLIVTQAAFFVQAGALAVLVTLDKVNTPALFALAAMQGIIFAFEAPARQSFVSEMVPNEDLTSAVALNSSLFNGARMLGGAAEALIVHYIGIAGCFYANAVSYAAVIVGILMMRESELFNTGGKGMGADGKSMKDALRYVRDNRPALALFAALFSISIFSMASFMFMPAFAKEVLHLGKSGTGILFAAIGAGAMVSTLSLATAKRARRQGLSIVALGVIFAVCSIAFSLSRNLYLSLLLLALAGAGLTAALSLTNSTLQSITPQNLRGSLMGMFVMIVVGMMPLGGFALGAAAKHFSVWVVTLGAGGACLVMLSAVALLLPDIFKIDERAELGPVAAAG